ncbi:YndM family protein [Radiobacillus kanasensis]|uniref:YndM family protein n=1 Tax=Radiobacillus kanasensis TaxID=2844358 RepID=UPI001E4D7098|nr:YndM family protein [Radiobacillus kanasensis]UFT98271.1 YndM family protein [Radiobacillus kanasensis]
MKHVKALGIKFLVISVVLYSVLGILNQASLGDIFLISVLVTGVAYVLGDLLILKNFGNLMASLADFALSFFAVWLLTAGLIQEEFSISISLFAAFLIACSEAVFHVYMQRKVLDVDEDAGFSNAYLERLSTEFAEENPDSDVIRLNKKKDNED